jgi:hypothetical protein
MTEVTVEKETALMKHVKTLYEYLVKNGAIKQEDLVAKKIVPEYTLSTIASIYHDIFIRIRLGVSGSRSAKYRAYELFKEDYINKYIWGIRGDERFLDLIADAIIVESTPNGMKALTFRLKDKIGVVGYIKIVDKIGYKYRKGYIQSYHILERKIPDE